jgi:hypothetical protein
MINAINLPKLRNPEYIQFQKDYLGIVLTNDPRLLNVQRPYDALVTHVGVLESIFVTEQGSAITEDISALDLRRDRALTGFTGMVNALTYHFKPETAKQAETVNRVLAKYGGSIARQNYQAETAIITNLADDLTNKADVAAAIAALNLGDWQRELEQANTAFNAAYLQRTQARGAVSKDTMFDKRAKTNEAFYKLRNFIDSYFTLNEGAAPYDKVTNELNALIDQYNTMMAGRQDGEKEDAPETPPAV